MVKTRGQLQPGNVVLAKEDGSNMPDLLSMKHRNVQYFFRCNKRATFTICKRTTLFFGFVPVGMDPSLPNMFSLDSIDLIQKTLLPSWFSIGENSTHPIEASRTGHSSIFPGMKPIAQPCDWWFATTRLHLGWRVLSIFLDRYFIFVNLEEPGVHLQKPTNNLDFDTCEV